MSEYCSPIFPAKIADIFPPIKGKNKNSTNTKIFIFLPPYLCNIRAKIAISSSFNSKKRGLFVQAPI